MIDMKSLPDLLNKDIIILFDEDEKNSMRRRNTLISLAKNI